MVADPEPDASGIKSLARLESSDSDAFLVWGNGENTFAAVFPSPGTDDPADTGTGTVTFVGNIPAVQTAILDTRERIMDDAEDTFIFIPDNTDLYMTAVEQTVAGTEVNLSFTPAFTTFHIKAAAESRMTVMSVQLSSQAEPIAGDFTGTFDGSAWTYGTESTENGITVTLNGSNGQILDAGESLHVAITALPFEVPVSGLTLRFNVKLDGNDAVVSRILDLKVSEDITLFDHSLNNGDYIVFEPCKEYYMKGLTIPGIMTSPADINWVTADQNIRGNQTSVGLSLDATIDWSLSFDGDDHGAQLSRTSGSAGSAIGITLSNMPVNYSLSDVVEYNIVASGIDPINGTTISKTIKVTQNLASRDPGHTVTFNTNTSSGYSTSDRTETKNNIEGAFSAISGANGSYISLSNNTTLSLSVTDPLEVIGITKVVFNCTGTIGIYAIDGITVTNGNGNSVAGTTTGTGLMQNTQSWTISNSAPDQGILNFRLSIDGANAIRLASYTVTYTTYKWED